MNDSYGKGLEAYYNGDENAVFIVESNIAETEEWNVSEFFRSYDDMPEAEKVALSAVSGSVLDVGAGAGSHSLYLQEKGFSVYAMDISEGAVNVMRKRGVKNIILHDFFTYKGERFDTILMLMNGIGIVGKLNRLSEFFAQADKLLTENGRIILDSSDLIYLYEEEDGSVYIDLNGDYYGELEYSISFGKDKGEMFPWLFVDYEKLKECAEANNFLCRKIFEDDHYLFVVEIVRK